MVQFWIVFDAIYEYDEQIIRKYFNLRYIYKMMES
mgnify:CR=1 FL=1